MRLTSEHKNIGLYIAKCVTGFALLSLIGELFSIPDMSWVVISMLLVTSPDGKEAIDLTIVRVKSNAVASVTSFVFLLLFSNVTLAICCAITVTILACYFFKLMAGSRAALAAVVIVSLHPLGEHLWSTAAERLAAVIAGCAMGLILTFAFHRSIYLRNTASDSQHSE